MFHFSSCLALTLQGRTRGLRRRHHWEIFSLLLLMLLLLFITSCFVKLRLHPNVNIHTFLLVSLFFSIFPPSEHLFRHQTCGSHLNTLNYLVPPFFIALPPILSNFFRHISRARVRADFSTGVYPRAVLLRVFFSIYFP